MLKSEYLATLVTLILTGTVFIYVRIRKRSTFPLPPGPKKLPLLGNLFDFPTSREWLTYAKLCKEHSMRWQLDLSRSIVANLTFFFSQDSDIIHLGALGLDFVILNSFDDAVELLEHRSSNYSDRSVASRCSARQT